MLGTCFPVGTCDWFFLWLIFSGTARELPLLSSQLHFSESESRSVVSDSATPWNNTVHGILQARILEWVAFPFFRGPSQPRDRTQVSHVAGGFFTSWATGKPKNTGLGSLSLLQQIFLTWNWTGVSCIACRFFTNWAIRVLWTVVLEKTLESPLDGKDQTSPS